MAEGNPGDPIPKSHLTQGIKCLFLFNDFFFLLLIASIQSKMLLVVKLTFFAMVKNLNSENLIVFVRNSFQGISSC